jgi:VWFA-related protein
MDRQRHVKQYAMQYLQKMPAGTRVAVLGAAYPNRLHILQGVTSDSALLSAAVDSMKYDTDAIAVNPITWTTQQEMRNRMTLESLQQIAADLAGIKGRKNLIWFTTGIPRITDPHLRLRDYSPELKKAYGLLAAAQVTVFPVWVRGVPADGDPIWEDWGAEELSMESVAEATGGTAFYNSNDLKAGIAKAIDTGSDYYTLSYVPPGSEYDGRHHTIKLETDKPGLHLTYRDEYYAEDPSKMTPAPGLTLAATLPAGGPVDMRLTMGRAMPTSQQILFDVGVESGADTVKATDPQGTILGTLDPVVKAKLKDKPLIRYDFNYAIPARQIAFTPGPNGTHNGSLELDIAVYDADAKLVTGLSQTVKMPLSDDKYRQFVQGPFRISQQIDLPAGQFFVRIGILDRTSNKVGTLEIPLTVTKGSGAVTAGR